MVINVDKDGAYTMIKRNEKKEKKWSEKIELRQYK